MNDIERILDIISDTEQLKQNDELSALVHKLTGEGELLEEELDMVAAATQSEYIKFRELITKLGK